MAGRTWLYSGVVVLVAVLAILLQRGRAPDPEPLVVPGVPNIVLIIADDLGWDDVGVYGNTGIKTPGIDQLARSGMLFSNAYLTTSSCSPSRASIVSGLYPHNTGAMHLHQSLDIDVDRLLPAILRKAGYYTAHIGKWHLGNTAWRAFDDVVVAKPDTSGAEEWLDALRARPADKPFFFMLASIDPHDPYAPDQIDKVHTPEDVVLPPYLVDTPATRQEFVDYYDEVARLDRHVSAVVAELERQGVYDNTLIIFMSDNGRPFHLAKTTLYDAGIKTPFIAVWPQRIAAGGDNLQLVSAVDIAPTLLAVAGIEAPRSMQGVSILPTLLDPGVRVRDYIFAEHNWHGRDAHERAVRSTDYLYIENQWPTFGHCRQSLFGHKDHVKDLLAAHEAGATAPDLHGCYALERPEQELYDVAQDPFSQVNLAGKLAYRQTVQDYAAMLHSWRELTSDKDFTHYEPPPQ